MVPEDFHGFAKEPERWSNQSPSSLNDHLYCPRWVAWSGFEGGLQGQAAVQARNGRFTKAINSWRWVRGVPPLNAAGTAQRAIPTSVSLPPAEMLMKYPG
jgi:hypothetical protein